MTGRFICHLVLIELFTVAERSFSALSSAQLFSVLILDMLSFAATVVFTVTDWPKLLDERRVSFIRPGFRRRPSSEWSARGLVPVASPCML